MGLAGLLALPGRLAAGQCRWGVAGRIPALERAGAGNGLLGITVLQDDAEKFATPGGVLLVEEAGRVAQRVRCGGVAVGRAERLGPPLLKACQEVLDRAGVEVQSGRDDRRGLMEATEAVPDLLTQRLGKGSRHRVTRK